MAVLNKIRKQESGMVLITVIGVVMVMSIFAISFLSQNTSQTASSQDQIDQIKAKELCAGVIAKSVSDLNSGLAITVPATEVMDNKSFTITAPNNLTTNLTATCSY